ncbi:MAG: site-specific DNA-methyltransferase [Candidatus Nanosalina sp.]
MSEEIDSVATSSADISDEKKKELRNIFPEVFEEGEVNIEKLKAIIGEDDISEGDGYSLNWTGRKNAIKNIQEPSKGTLAPKKERSVNFESSENLLIEGENLETLKLLKKSYSNSVKMIYIDPPYNTGKEFVYNDDYSQNLQNYLEKTGQVDADGNKLTTNRETNGRFHSDWLSMMYPRLFISKTLLQDDGAIFVSIDDNEVHNLRMIMNEIFGEENFVANLVWTNKEGGGGSDSKYFREKHEYILCYAKDKEKLDIKGTDISNRERYRKEDEHVDERGPYYLQQLNQTSIQYSESLDYEIEAPDGTKIDPHKSGERACWRWSKEKVEWGIENDFIEFKERDGEWKVYTKQYLHVDNEGNEIDRTQPPLALIDQFSSTQATKKLKELFGGQEVFSYPKPYELIKWLSERVTEKDDLVLDFFAGSGSLGEAIFRQNQEDGGDRNFIMIQLQEDLPEVQEVDNGRTLETVTDVAEERLKRILDGKSDLGELDEGFKVFRLEESNYKVWDSLSSEESSVEDVKRQMKLFETALVEDYEDEDVLYEILLKEGMSLNAELERRADRPLYEIRDEEDVFYVSLDNDIGEEIIEGLEYNQDTVFICLDNALEDSEKINLSNKLKLKTI